jgi:HEPN domain-containing protein
MKKITQEWLDKALADARTAEREGQVQQDPNWDAVCFHAQQAVEKALKALLQNENVAFPKTHDLGDLLNRLLAIYPDLASLQDSLEWLTTFAVEIRYPGESAFAQDARRSLAIMQETMQLITAELQSKKE